MKTFKQFIAEDSHGGKKLPWDKNPQIGWHEDGDHTIMYHGTHQKNLAGILKDGIHAPKDGDTAGMISMTHDPHTAHGYASMTGGETNWRRATSGKTVAKSVPHNERVVLVAKIPHSWKKDNLVPGMKGNIDAVRDNLTNKQKYTDHVAKGGRDHEYYATTELRFKDKIPPHFIVGYMKKVD